MTTDQVLLTVLVIVTAIGVVIAYAGHRRQSTWRQRDLRRDLFSRWGEEVGVPAPADAPRLVLNGLQRLPVEKDANFPLAHKLVSKGIRRQYQQFLGARCVYVEACHNLYERVGSDCVQRTGLPLGSWGQEPCWPEEVLLPPFVDSIYRKMTSEKQLIFAPEAIEYTISNFSSSGRRYRRIGIWLTLGAPEESFSGTLAEITSERIPESAKTAKLQQVQAIHQEMMGEAFLKQFDNKVADINQFREKAQTLAEQFRAGLSRVATS